MNSVIHLSQNPPSVAPESLSSASGVHVSLSHGSLSVSQWCKQSRLVSRPLYVKCTLDRFSEGTKMKEEHGNKNNILRGVGRASLVLACVLGAFALSGKVKPKPNIAYAAGCEDRSRSAVSSPKKSFLKTEHPDVSEIEGLKLYAMDLSLNEGCEDAAVKMLSNECERFKGKAMSNALRVALIELLLYQKKHPEAKKRIEELLADIGPEGVSDVPKERLYLLKAIAESETEIDRAKESWESYLDELNSSPFAVKRSRSPVLRIFGKT